MRSAVFCLLIFPLYSYSFAQGNQVLPVQFQQFFKSYPLLNPASIGIDSDLELKTGDKALTGVFKGVRTYYLNVNFVLNRKEAEKAAMKHVIGGIFINDKEGTYFSRSRASLVYAIHVPLKKNLTLNGGASAGFVNYAYKGSNLGGGGSSFGLSSDAGVWLHGPDFNLGLSWNQLFPAKLKPLEQVLILKRHLNINGEKAFHLNPDVSLMPVVSLRFADREYYDIDMAMLGIIQQLLSLGINYKYQKGFSFIGGIEKIRLGEYTVQLMFSYFTVLSRTTIYNPQAFEISLNLTSERKK